MKIKRIKVDVAKLRKYILASLGYIEERNSDAPLLSVFSGAIIEQLGRSLRIHSWREKPGGYENCFNDFLENYLPRYAPYKKILWKGLRCEGVHTGLAQTSVNLTCEKKLEKVA